MSAETAALGPSYRNVFITGASSGLGRALSLWFARRGAHVFAAARRREALESLEQEASALGKGTVSPLVMDVEDTTALVRKLQELDAAVGGIDCVVANAGRGAELSARHYSWEALAPMVQLNVVAATATLGALIPRMVERRRGHLVAVSSLAAWIVPPKSGVYCATKTYVTALCRALRMDLAASNIQVTALHPGFVRTEMTAKNKFSMPFLIEADDAAERMGRAILRAVPSFAFPWQTHALVRAASLLPDSLVRAVTARAMR